MSNSPLSFHVITLFPELFEPFLKSSILGKAIETCLLSVSVHDLRPFGKGRHLRVDDAPYGGGAGMVICADVLFEAWQKVTAPLKDPKTLLLSPQGRLLTSETAREWADLSNIVLICGHYEGVDERFVEECVDDEISIGDYVLTGGEIPAMAVIDAVSRFCPGVVGKEESVESDSLEGGLLKYPQFTRPPEFRNRKVPDILLSGNHREIKRWREGQSAQVTQRKRPDLWTKFASKEQSTKS